MLYIKSSCTLTTDLVVFLSITANKIKRAQLQVMFKRYTVIIFHENESNNIDLHNNKIIKEYKGIFFSKDTQL